MADLGERNNAGVDPTLAEQDYQLLKVCEKFDKKMTPKTPITSLDFEIGARNWTADKFTLYLQILSSTKKMIQRVTVTFEGDERLYRQVKKRDQTCDGLFTFPCDRFEGDTFTVTFIVFIRGVKTEHQMEVQVGAEMSEPRACDVPQKEPKKTMAEQFPEMDIVEMHGRNHQPDWEAPLCMVECDEKSRPTLHNYPAHEYEDRPRTLLSKVKELARLLRASKSTLCYSGAGLSTSAGIDDYATKAGKQSKINIGRAKKPRTMKSAIPSLGHRAFCALANNDLVHNWIQQNHDGLPQKAGFPQHRLNEIHGAWFDPSNPVVAMSGTLRDDLYAWMEKASEEATLCLAVGTSLSGMNADHVFEDQCDANEADPESCLGGVIIGLQKTQHDGKSSLRIYARIDVVVALLLREMNIMLPPLVTPFVPQVREDAIIAPDVFRVPYDARGHLTDDPDQMVVWDLRDGAEIVVVDGPGKGFKGRIQGRNQGHYNCVLPRQRKGHPDFGKVPRNYLMGSWWAKTATDGDWRILPVVNKNAVLQSEWTSDNL